MQNIELLTANSILKRGVRYKVPAPLLFRILGIRRIPITITQLLMGTEIRVARILAEHGIPEEMVKSKDMAKFMLEHYNTVLRIVAISTINQFRIPWLTLRFRMYVLRGLSTWRLFELYSTVRQYSGLSPFMNITRLIVMTRVTKPNLGQVESGG